MYLILCAKLQTTYGIDKKPETTSLLNEPNTSVVLTILNFWDFLIFTGSLNFPDFDSFIKDYGFIIRVWYSLYMPLSIDIALSSNKY